MESSSIEYKEMVDSKNKKYLKEIVAFLNTSGGEIIFGINDDGQEVGIPLEIIDDEMLKVTSTVFDCILPRPIDFVTIDIYKKNLIKIVISKDVENSQQKPFFIKTYGMSPRGVFVRKGSSSIPLEQAEIDEIYMNSNPKHEKPLENIEALHQDFDFKILEKYYRINDIELTYVKKKNRGLYTNTGKISKVGEIFADENSNFIPVAKFNGDDKTAPLIANTNYGEQPLNISLEEVIDKMDAENEVLTHVSDIKREEKYAYSKRALRESIINAFVHNDYLKGFPRFFIFKNRIEIISYGGLVAQMTKEGFWEGESIPRNTRIVDIFRDLKITESIGRGIPIIIQEYSKEVFKISENEVKVILYKRDNETATKSSKTATKDSKTATKDNETATKDSEVATKDSKTATKGSKTATKDNETAIKSSEVATKDSKTATKSSEVATKYDENDTVTYKIKEKIYNLILNEDDAVNSHIVSQKLNINKRSSQRYLKDLYEEGRIKREKKGASYLYYKYEEV